MAPISDEPNYVINPDGEVIFVLEVPGAPFAVWSEQPDRPGMWAIRSPEGTEEPAEKNQVGRHQGQSYDVQTQPKSAPTDPTTGAWKKTGKRPHTSVYRAPNVSLASMEENPLRKLERGRYTRPEWICRYRGQRLDPSAFLLLMRINHGGHHDLPEKISLDQLAQLTVLVDYYDCKKIVMYFANGWAKVRT